MQTESLWTLALMSILNLIGKEWIRKEGSTKVYRKLRVIHRMFLSLTSIEVGRAKVSSLRLIGFHLRRILTP